MNLGILTKKITVQDLYNYSKCHGLLNSEASIVLDIIYRERNLNGYSRQNNKESIVSPVNDDSTIDFGFIEYSTEDVINLFNS